MISWPKQGDSETVCFDIRIFHENENRTGFPSFTTPLLPPLFPPFCFCFGFEKHIHEHVSFISTIFSNYGYSLVWKWSNTITRLPICHLKSIHFPWQILEKLSGGGGKFFAWKQPMINSCKSHFLPVEDFAYTSTQMYGFQLG